MSSFAISLDVSKMVGWSILVWFGSFSESVCNVDLVLFPLRQTSCDRVIFHLLNSLHNSIPSRLNSIQLQFSFRLPVLLLLIKLLLSFVLMFKHVLEPFNRFDSSLLQLLFCLYKSLTSFASWTKKSMDQIFRWWNCRLNIW